MTIHEAVRGAWRQPLISGLFLLLTAQMALIFAVQRDGRGRRALLPLLAHFAVSVLMMYFPFYDITLHRAFPEGAIHSSVLSVAMRLPAALLALYEGVSAILLIFSARDVLRYRRSHLTRDSIKETMDLMPMGVAYCKPDGVVLFRNLAMDHLAQGLTGKLFTDLNLFRSAAGDLARIPLKGRVWQATVRETASPDGPMLQVTATDITEQAGITAELEAKNKKLKDMHLRLEIYNRQAERLIIAQEMLTARMTVHDELGHVLLESRRYLNDPTSFDETLFLQALKNTNTYLLREYEQDDTARDPLADAIDTAEAIGVEVTIAGRIPTDEPCRGVLAAAIRECAANAVKHADGDALSVRIREDGNALRFILESSGRPPVGPIRESGGLLSLRALAESRGGDMRVETAPVFRLTLTLPA